jgi:squalene-hopene/tetraprenyl-beta-curcumene cyclase
MLDFKRLQAAHDQARDDLLAERVAAGHWVGELSASALSTATAVSALAIVARSRRDDFAKLIERGLAFLVKHQNDDGGWGDTDRSYSNIATTMLALAAFELGGRDILRSDARGKAEKYINSHGGIAGLRARYGKDKTFAVPILTNAALAGMVSWSEVARLPFELACLPPSWYRFLHLPVVSYAIPALVAIGQAVHRRRTNRNPLTWLVRSATVGRSLRVLESVQPSSGGFLEATPLTSFVVMSLADSPALVDHSVVQRGVRFLIDSVRPDGSWPIDTNLATWNTTLATGALAAADENVGTLGVLDYILSCQRREVHPYTSSPPGGWAWTDLSGGVPDVDDTSAALLALATLRRDAAPADRTRIDEAAAHGTQWLLGVQNRDGGWPTFCRGWGTMPFDRSAPDLTAHAIRALAAWGTAREFDRPIRDGLGYLLRSQRADGSWVPLWFGNQDEPEEENPVYGTARVLAALRDLDGAIPSGPLQTAALRAVDFLRRRQNADGGWGRSGSSSAGRTAPRASSVEETALALEGLFPWHSDPAVEAALARGLDWLVAAVEDRRHRACAPIGFYFAKLWYYERLFPLTFTVSALGQAVARLRHRPQNHWPERPASFPPDPTPVSPNQPATDRGNIGNRTR